ncbi:MAG TPA: hypothetical protein VMU63_08860 [Acidimicrobiales bacterium]|nr:hypothetical protein [Acidimicrobiales bacterium]
MTTDYTLPSSIEGFVAQWDAIVREWMTGWPPWDPELHLWAESHRDFTTRINKDALPEPFIGDLRRRPAAVLLSLNPGKPYMGSERWAGKYDLPEPDLQSRNGRFAREIREDFGGSYAAWASRWQDWKSLTGGRANTFITSRLNFVRNWLNDGSIELDDLVLFELYPWHSARWGGGLWMPEAVGQLILSKVFIPLAILTSLETGAANRASCYFAFGKAWSISLGSIDAFTLARGWGRGYEERWAGASPSRSVELWVQPTVGAQVLVMYHSGGAGPPKKEEVPAIRQVVEPYLWS